MDIKIDNEFNVIFDNDLKIVDGVEEQKQKLFLYLKTPIGGLYNKNYGLNFKFLLKLLKTHKKEDIKTFFANNLRNLNINILNISTRHENKKIILQFFLAGDTLSMEYKL
ncbi:DUF2634 domain-containing protein (plasmid) [Borrelia miyamotoi]|uniref:DUF2634 domain-containing protein n=1 Tax=Borrelia miyamotoi TaxID=47466 RepID=A0AAP8YVE1_9SPIR|nr:DUF2634 domain-containing protein [Borrelia miyamotoi]AHH05494.1 Hypothetical protein BOM_0951 [Borrelia miyamotoi FR64b]ATQ15286.1 DUF2634 domain-containing protein [Borrelia miyamotoi]ATQ16403.1 DUF2634 domain-containing protein [Borrelia miyamotoi]ATQ17616.1 DUF2634 domain-containing protein [Borrelia miyamotoi]ATQ18859.1 DUF2634 domain-containing protein [Borrelia miyamotoi]